MQSTLKNPPIMYTRYFALLIGISFLIAGVGAFLPLVTASVPHDAPHLEVGSSYRMWLGIFPVNLIHNLVHLSLGILGVAAYRDYKSSRLYARGLAVLLALFTVLGIVKGDGFGIIPLFGHDIWLHGLEAAAAGYLGFFVKEPQRIQADA